MPEVLSLKDSLTALVTWPHLPGNDKFFLNNEKIDAIPVVTAQHIGYYHNRVGMKTI